MKIHTMLFSALLIAGPAIAHEEKEAFPTAPVMTAAEGSVYGTRWPADAGPAMTIEAASGKVDALKNQSHAFSGRITEVCQDMGCWIVLAGEDGKFARVAMHDHSFGVPKDSKGEAVVYGTLSEKTISKKEADHLVADGAKAPASTELHIDALSVLIRNES
ncbi:MAG: DUF4920 domain-containing protein [Dokdonella sp.]